MRLPPLLILAPLLACAPKSEHTSSARISADSLVRPYPASDFLLRIPARWAGLDHLDTVSTQERGDALPGALQYSYLPQDGKAHSETLVAVAVYDSAAWAHVRADSGPPPGDSVAAKNGRIYIVALPQSNPFASGTTDSTAFASLELTSAEARVFVVPD